MLAAAFNGGDLNAFVDVYDEQAVLVVPPAGRRISGRAEIRNAMREIFQLRPKARIDVVDKVEADGLALTLAQWALDGTDPSGHPVRLRGRGTIVSRRQPDGSWRILLDQPMRPERMPDVTIQPLANGPYKVGGPIRRLDADGRDYPVADGPVYLCRYGASRNKPFCDGAHAGIGFKSIARVSRRAA